MSAVSEQLAATADTSTAAAGVPYALLGLPWTVGMLVFWLVVAAIAIYGGDAFRRARNAAWLGRLPGGLGALPTEDRPNHERPSGFKVARLVADPVTGEASFLGLTLGGQYGPDDTADCEVLSGWISPPRRWGRRRQPEPHEAPDLSCTCGFYALQDRAEAADLLATRPPVSRMFGPVLLEVDFAGTVVEFEHGFRASHQRVLGVQVPRWCVPCARLGVARRAERFAGLAGDDLERACRSDLPQHPPLYRYALAAHHTEVVRRLDGLAALRPVCDEHTAGPQRVGTAPPADDDGDTDRPPAALGAASTEGQPPRSSVVLELADLAAGLGTEVRWLDDDAFDLARFVETVSWPPPPRGSLGV